MSKAYLLAICLLATTLTGCLADDTSDSIEQDENTEKETIEPVGMNNNETNDYDELISEIQNLTAEVNSLKSDMNDMLYDPAEYSNISLKTGYTNPLVSGDGWNTLNFSKMGNTLHMNASYDIPNDYEIWFYDNTGSLIKYGQIITSYDQCYTDGNWTTSYFECLGNTSEIIYEFNLVREPVSVAYGQSMTILTLESFP